MTSNGTLACSFRDPSGFIFQRDGVLYRQINRIYADHYQRLMDSGLYGALTRAGLLIAHEEVALEPARAETAYKIIRPVPVPFISYPYEWPFSAFKRAALATLAIHKTALEHGMALKDASAYNIQFVDAKPVFIDTLSFETCREGSPWVAYQQFCKHFLAPLALMALRDIRLGQWMREYIDGMPLDLASALLPWKTRFSPGLLMHVHLHAKSQSRHADDAAGTPGDSVKTAVSRKKMNRLAMLGLIDSLETTIKKLRWKPPGTEWGSYYEATNYSAEAMEEKSRLVERFLGLAQPKTVWDLGANTGRFSRIASRRDIETISFDIDPVAVEKNFRGCQEHQERHLLPLLQDLTNPSPAIGWQNAERDSLLARGPADTVLALALIHHLAISNNVPLGRLAEFFAAAGRTLIVEFVPKSDSQVRRLLSSREDIFPEYTREGFEAAFKEAFTIDEVQPIRGSERMLYYMRKKL